MSIKGSLLKSSARKRSPNNHEPLKIKIMFNRKLKKQLQELIQSNGQLKEEIRRLEDAEAAASYSHVSHLSRLNEERVKLKTEIASLSSENRRLADELSRSVKRDPKTGRYTKKKPKSEKA